MKNLMRLTSLIATLGAAVLLAGCERPPIDAVQRGYRGLAMEQVYNPRTLAQQIPQNQPPAAMDIGSPDGPKAGEILQNVKVLGDLSIGQFTAQMAAITAWVSPKEGCAYCHDLANLADDSKYTKIVARRMIEMTQRVNADWKPHVAETGVTCYTCHRGNPVPALTWTQPLAQDMRANFIGNLNGQNLAAPTVGLAALPADPVTAYLIKPTNIRVVSKTALPTGNTTSIQATESTYALMFHISGALGVNCTYCHNSRSFGDWTESPPQRTTAWHGISMVRNLNTDYVLPLAPLLPKDRLGPNGDAPIVACATCHQGAYKPLYGAQMAKEWPGLRVTTPEVPALPPPLVEPLRSVLYFDIDSHVLHGPQSNGLANLIVALKERPASKATISGYHSAAGTLEHNAELAKQRAFNVRDALVAAGVPATRVLLQKPQQTAANVRGEDPSARRVEVTVR